MKMKQFQLCVLFLVIVNVANGGDYPSCPEAQTGALNGVKIEGCDPSQPCQVKRGQSVNLEVDFTPSANSASLQVDALVVSPEFPVPIPFPGFDTNGCQAEHNIQCPLVANTRYSYRNRLTVLAAAPTGEAEGELQLKDASSNIIACFMINITITN